MSINHLYLTWLQQIRQLRPDEHKARVRNVVWLLVGIYASQSVHLSQIALKIPWAQATLPSAVRRLHRLLANPKLRVRAWYEPIARHLLEAQAHSTGTISWPTGIAAKRNPGSWPPTCSANAQP